MAEFKLGRLRFVFKGTWVTGTVYVKDDIARYGGTSYVCTAGHTANADFDADFTANRWQVMASGQSWVNNDWTPSTTYKLNDLVKYGGNVYVCLDNHVSNATANGGFYINFAANLWDLFVSGVDYKGIWLPNSYYKENDLVKYNGRSYLCVTAHASIIGSYQGESITGVNIVSAGTGYTNGNALNIGPPDLPGGVQAAGFINVGGASDSILSINITEAGSGYINIPTISVSGPGNGAILVGVLSISFVNGLETDQDKWQLFSDGFQWRDEWNGSEIPGTRVPTSYAVNDVVKFGGGLYICTLPHTSNATAFEESYWDIFTKGLEYQSTWSGATEYQLGDVVSYGGFVYVAKQRHTAQIPPLAPQFWDLLTQGFNNRQRYVISQSYKVGDVIQYGGNVYQADAEVIPGETPYSAPVHWKKLLDGFRWLNEWSQSPAEGNYKIGDVVKYIASTYIVSDEHVPSENGQLVIEATSATGNLITVAAAADTDQLNLNQSITFTGTGFGGIANGVIYFVKSIASSATFTISDTQGGATKTLTSATGSLLGAFTTRPDLDDGLFFQSFVEGDANNVLTRRGDLVTRNAIQNVRLPMGQSGTFLKVGDRDLEWNLVGQLDRIFYVSLEGSNSNDGTTFDSAWRTIKYACNFVMNSGLNTRGTPVVINVKTGVYFEQFPISVPKYVSLVGDELRMSVIEPTPETSGSDKFYLRDSTTVRNFTFRGATGANIGSLPGGSSSGSVYTPPPSSGGGGGYNPPSGGGYTPPPSSGGGTVGQTAGLTAPNQYGTARPTGGAWVSLDPGTGPNDESVWVGERSPYVQNVTLFGDFCVGQKIDGALHNGGNKSITSNDFTTILSNGIGAWCTNQGRGELVSVFAYYSYMGYLCENGGVIRATNGNNSYGTFGSVSEGVDPTEISRTSNVDNRRFEAQIDRVQTDGSKILYVEYVNAGETYTTAQYGFSGSGTTGTISSTAQPVNGGVCEVQVLTSGENYTSVVNNAQAGSNIDIRLGAADIALTNAYVGERILLTDGVGSGQYAYITSSDGGSKLVTLGMESFTPLVISATTAGTNVITTTSTASLSVDMPFTFTGLILDSLVGVGFGGLAPSVQYYVKAVVDATTFTAYTNIDTKAVTVLSTGADTMLLHKSGWDVFVYDITETITAITNANPVSITTAVPHAIFDGMQVVITGVVGTTQLNANTYYAAKTSATTFTLYQNPTLATSVDSTAFGVYASGGTVIGSRYIPEFLNTTSRYVIEPRVIVSTGVGATATAVQTLGIDAISVSDGGQGFTTPPSVIINGDGTSTGGFGAEATTAIQGAVEEVIVVTKGTGYTTVPTLTFVGGGLPNNDSRHATATATVSKTISTVAVTLGGTGFTAPPSVTTTGSGGSGAIISSQISNVVGNVNITNNGTGYTSPPSVVFVGGQPLEFATGIAVLSATVASITVQEGGSGYAPGSTTVTLIGGDPIGSVATAEAVIDFGNFVAGTSPGVITSVTVLTAGSGYRTPPVVSIAGVGSNASATANISGSVNSVTVTNAGRGYQTTPTITFAGGSGSGAAGTVTLTGSVISLTVVDGGRAWTSIPTLAFTGGGGSGATAVVTAMDTVLDTISITGAGSEYTSNPAISVASGAPTPQTFTVISVANPDGAGAIYQIDGFNKPVLTLVRGGVYTFDQSAASNATHQIAFKDSTGAAYTQGVVTTGPVGTAGAQTVITVAANAPNNLRYYCVTHGNNMGNMILVTSTVGTGIVLRSRINGIVTAVTVTDPGGSFAVAPLITFVNGSQLKGVVIGQRYYRNASEFLGIAIAQQPQTLAGIDQIRLVARAVSQNLAPAVAYQNAVARVSGSAGPSGIQNAVDVLINSVYYTIQNGQNYSNSPALLDLNREFLRAEAMAFWSANYPGIATAVYSRDVGLVIDAIIADLSGSGVGHTLVAGINAVFLGTARTANLLASTDGIDHVRDLALNIIQNIVVAAPATGITVTQTAVSTNVITAASTAALSVNDRIIFVGTTFGGVQANFTYFVKEIINGTTFTIATAVDGAVVLLGSATGSMTVSTQAVDDELTLESGALTAVTNLFNYTKSIVSTTVANVNTFNAVANLINSNRSYIRAETIAFINTTYQDFDYNQVVSARDVGYIVDALVYDLKNAVETNPTVSSTTTGVVSDITVVSGGVGYGLGTTVTLTGGSPSVPATAAIVFNQQTGVITGFNMTNKGKGYSSAPTVGIVADTGSGAFVRARIVGGAVDIVTIINPGSGYAAGPNIQLIDANNTSEGTFKTRVANGVLSQPRFTSRGIGFTTADALVDGDGFADISQVGQFVYIDNLTNIPTPGANIQFANTPEQFFKLVSVREIQGPEGIIGARLLVTENKAFIQYELVNYLTNFTYNTAEFAQDIEYIIEAMCDDFTYGGNGKLLSIIQKYQRGLDPVFDQQRIQIVYGLLELQEEIVNLINTPISIFANKIDFLIEWIENSERNQALPALSMPNGSFDTEDDRAKNVLLANTNFAVEQTIAWMTVNSKIVGRDNVIFRREIREILRTVAYDLTYTGNSLSVEYAVSFYVGAELQIPGVPGTSAAAKAQFLETIQFVNDLLQDIATNEIVTPLSGNTVTQNTALPPGDTPGSTGRINTLATVIYNIVNVGFAASGVTKIASNFAGFNTATKTTVLAAKSALSGDVTDYIDATFVNYTYDQAVFFNDVGIIVQALADDIFGDVAKSVEAGQRFYAVTAALTANDTTPQTIAAIAQIDYIIQQVIRNVTYTRTQTAAFQTRFPSITNGAEASVHLGDTAYIIRDIVQNGTAYDAVKQLLLDNKTFVQAEVVAFVNASFETLDYSEQLCARDVGLIIDAVVYDIYGGLSRSREAGLRYYQSASALAAITGDQGPATIAAMNYLNDILQAILNNLDPVIKFQEALTRISDATIVADVDRLGIDVKVALTINTIIGIINAGPSSLPAGRYAARLQISPPLSILTAPAHDTAMVIRSRYSQVRLTGHDFLNIGTGSKNDTNYPGIPLNAPNANQELVERGGGRVFFTSTDQDGNFRVGELFKVEQSTGIATLNADAFNLSGLNELALGGVSLGGSGAVINEFSTDGTFFANSDRIVPTQKAIRTYIQSALGSGGGNIAVNAVTAGDVFITGRDIDTIGGLQLSLLPVEGVLINSTVNSISPTSGALQISGGVGIVNNLNVGGSAVFSGNITSNSTAFVKISAGSTEERTSGPAGSFRFNTSTARFEGYNGTAWTDVGGTNPYIERSAPYTAVIGDQIFVNTSSAGVTITLPASPTIGGTVKFVDGAGTFDFNNLTINRNGNSIMGDAENLIVDTKNAAFTLIYYNITYGWRLGDA